MLHIFFNLNKGWVHTLKDKIYEQNYTIKVVDKFKLPTSTSFF